MPIPTIQLNTLLRNVRAYHQDNCARILQYRNYKKVQPRLILLPPIMNDMNTAIMETFGDDVNKHVEVWMHLTELAAARGLDADNIMDLDEWIHILNNL